MEKHKGWISIHRKITDHWLYQEKRTFSKFEAWLDILMEVNHSEVKTTIQNKLFTVKIGQSINSLDTWSKRWNWNKSRVRRFLKMLEDDKMIRLRNEFKTTRLTVCKYEDYQVKRNADETDLKRKRNADETELTPNNNVNKENKDNKEINKYKIPPFEVFLSHAKSKIENICEQSVKLKYDSWVENEWRDGNNKQIKNWKSKLTNTVQYLKVKEVKTGYDPTKNVAL